MMQFILFGCGSRGSALKPNITEKDNKRTEKNHKKEGYRHRVAEKTFPLSASLTALF